MGDDVLALPFPRRVAAAIQTLAKRVPVRFMHGNRDFLVAQGFARATGAQLIADPERIDLHGHATLLLHGDTLCIDDAAYQAFRAQVRDPGWQRVALSRSLEERVELAKGMRAQSEGAKQAKAMEIMDVSQSAVERAFAESNCDVMIHGHTHRPGRHVYRVAGRERVRWVLPDWYERGGYLEASPEGIRAIEAV